jgi:predicted nucleic acid-binding protein
MMSIASSPRIGRAGRAAADIYLDACCFIYLVEGQPGWRTVVEKRLRDFEPTSRLITSQLARLECRTKPTRDGNRELLERYDMLFGAGRVVVLDVSAESIDRATDLRARHGFKTPDAIHLATAIESAATEFWTGDAAFSRCTDIAVTVLLPTAP